jgi:YVTN family beta-propeller protein
MMIALLAATLHGMVVVANMNDNTATIIDLATHRTIATLPTGAGPHEVAISHNGRWAVVSNYGPQKEPGHTLTVIDLAPRIPVVVRTIDLGADNTRPHGSAFLPGDTTLLVTVQTAQAVMVINVPRGTVDASIPTHGRATHMVALTADGRHAYTSNVADGTVSELDITGRAFVRSFNVAPLVEGIGVTPNGAEVWVGSDSVKTVSVVPTSSGTVTTTVSDFGFPYRIAITPDGRTAVVSDPGRGELRFMDVGTHTEIGRVAIPATDVVATAEFPKSPCPEGLSMAPDGRTVFVTLQGRNAVAAVDVATRTLLLTLPVGRWPDGIAYSPLEHN